MSRSKIILFLPLFAAMSLAAFGQTSTPLEAVRSFYQFDRSHSDVLSKATIEARRKWLSPTLYRLFQNELRRQNAYLKKYPTNKPYFGDGLSFTPIDETCGKGGKGAGKRLTFREADQGLKTARISAIFAFPKPCTDPDTTIYTLKLIKVKSDWLIDNVYYDGDSNLAADLRRKEY